jgi:hypothetical protein
VAVNGTLVNEENLRTMGDVMQAIEDSYYSRNSMDIKVLGVEQLWIEFIGNPHFGPPSINGNYQQQQNEERKPSQNKVTRELLKTFLLKH